MREAPTKFRKSKNLITKEGYSTNQNLGNNQLNPPHKKSILGDSYIHHDILSSRSQFRRLSTSSALYYVSQLSQLSITSTHDLTSQLLFSSTSINESQEITQQLPRSSRHQTVCRNVIYIYIYRMSQNNLLSLKYCTSDGILRRFFLCQNFVRLVFKLVKEIVR